MNIRYLINLLASVFAASLLLTSQVATAEATLPEVYQAVQSGQMAKADAMMKEVLQNHPNRFIYSYKSHNNIGKQAIFNFSTSRQVRW